MIDSYQFSDSYDDLLKRMTLHAKQKEIDNQIFEILKRFFEKELDREKRPFSRSDRAPLFQQVAKAILADAIGRIEGAK